MELTCSSQLPSSESLSQLAFSGTGKRDWRVVLHIGSYILPIMHADLAAEHVPETSEPDALAPDASEPAQSSAEPVRRGLWALLYYSDIEPVWWIATATILLLDEALRSGTAQEAARIQDLLAEVRRLRDLLDSIDEAGRSTIPIPLSYGTAPSADSTCISDFEWKLQVSPEFANDILERRYRAELVHVLASRIPSHARLGFTLRTAVDLCARTCMLLSDEEAEKLRDIRTKIHALVDDAMLEECLSPLHKESVILGEIVRIGVKRKSSWRIVAKTLDAPIDRGGFDEISKLNTRLCGTLAVKRELGKLGGQNREDGMEEGYRLAYIPPHLNILPLFGYSTDGVVTLVMPWAENGSLEGYLKKNPEANRRRLLQQVASGLAHLHTYHVVHGDIHMKNILISGEGDALLCDFGLSKILRHEVASTSSTPPQDPNNDFEYDGQPEGVTVYISPERHVGGPRSRASDVFAFGMLCFQTYSGTMPMRRCPNDMAIIIALSRGQRPTRDEVSRADFTDGLWELVQRCWAQTPEDRPSMDVVAQLLREMDSESENRSDSENVPETGQDSERAVTVKTKMKVFPRNDNDLRDYAIDQLLGDSVRSSMQLMELIGLKEFVADVLGPEDFTPLTALLKEARADVDHYPPNVPDI